ncbi:MAG: hypothetical protein IPN69_15660 [Acidobacteria bacterium]|nr:hypothetical protein [Acidobacteriota bacterium]MBK8147860.1 hypothetical protein [Acidobacteriota bacterium]MBK8812146.1 hypothetical protein [Acidobacteriota bacterium]
MGFVKRFLPFFVAFAIGLFVASFFVSVGFSRFERHGSHKRNHCKKRMNVENEQLRRENFELRNRVEQLKLDVPPVETMPMDSVPRSRSNR